MAPKKQLIQPQPVAYTLTESVDINLLSSLLLSTDKFCENDLRIILQLYKLGGTHICEYKATESFPNGRLYNANTIFGLSKKYRAYLCYAKYVDLDINNCHPTILYNHISDTYPDLDLTPFKLYLDNCNEYRKKYKNIKINVLAQINDTMLYESNDMVIQQLYNCLFKCVQKVPCMSELLQNKERILIDIMIKYFKIENVISICHDGLIVKSCNLNDIANVNNLLKFYTVSPKPFVPAKFNTYDPSAFKQLKSYNTLPVTQVQGGMYACLEIIRHYVLKNIRLYNSSTYIFNSENEGYYLVARKLKSEHITVSCRHDSKTLEFGISDGLKHFGSFLAIFKFDPFKSSIPGVLSTYKLPYAASLTTPSNWQEIVKDYLYLVNHVLLRDDENVIKYVHAWHANVYQLHPQRTNTMLIYTGDEGTGKSLYTNTHIKAFGPYLACCVKNVEELTTKFNKGLYGKVFVNVAEGRATDYKSMNHELDTLKDYIDGETLTIEAKGVDTVVCKNAMNIVYNSNYASSIKYKPGIARRVNHFDVISHHDLTIENYYKPLALKLHTDEMLASVYKYYMTYDFSDINVKQAIHTTIKSDGAWNQLLTPIDRACELLKYSIKLSGATSKTLTASEFCFFANDMKVTRSNTFTGTEAQVFNSVTIGKLLARLVISNKISKEVKSGNRAFYTMDIEHWPQLEQYTVQTEQHYKDITEPDNDHLECLL